MPRSKAVDELAEGTPETAADAEALDLLRFVARSIRVVSMSGKKMTNKCSLCPTARLHREPCRHDAIWQIAGV